MRISGARTSIVPTLAVLAALAACADTPTAGPAEPSLGLSAAADTTVAPPDTIIYEGEQEYEDVARQVPGYAAHYFSEDGDLVVALTDRSQEALALRVIQSRPQPELADGERRTGVTRVVDARYPFAQLRDWRNAATFPVLDVPGVVAVDLDEVRNRVAVWLADPAPRAQVEAVLQKAGVPLAGTIIEVTGRPEELQTLQNFFRPLQGGYQVRTPAGAQCSLGSPVPTTVPRYFVASHCTQAYWNNSGTAFYQPAVAPAWFIGNETLDPPGWPCGANLCRWSDAAVINVGPGVPWANQIARTTFAAFGWAPGSINTAAVPAFNAAVAPQWWPLANQLVDKVGRTTGWNRGVVTHTCVNLTGWAPTPGGRTVMCQYLATNMSGPGDSGAPVFRQLAVGAQVTGLLWGNFNLPGFQRSIFSPRGGMFTDLGV